MSAELQFVGVGEAVDPALANTSVLYRGARTLLVDCGYSVPHALWAIDRDFDFLDGIYLTHTHADHAFGIPALLIAMRLGGRTRPLDLLGGPGVRAWVERALELGYPGAFAPHKCFELRHHEISPGTRFEWGPLCLSNARTGHGVPNHAVRIESTEHPPVCVSGDGAPTDAVQQLYDHAGELVQECFWARTPSDPKAAAKHADLERIIELIDVAKVARVHLLHFCADRKAEIEGAIEDRKDPRLRVARAGARIVL